MQSELVIVSGARPSIIKLAPVLLAARQRGVPVRFVLSGQHGDTLDGILSAFGITPDVVLSTIPPGTITARTAALLGNLAGYFDEHDTGTVIVNGDTTTALCAALAARLHTLPLAHVEAGLRTHSDMEPHPEEINRRLVGQLATTHFAPTELAAANLRAEGIDRRTVHVVGNTIIDAVRIVRDRIAANAIEGVAEFAAGLEHVARGRRIVTVTMHRAENFVDGQAPLPAAVRKLALEYDDALFVLPVHPRPAVTASVQRQLAQIDNVHLLPPLPYANFLRLLEASCLALTDSGGIQEEATALGLRVICMRNVTERPEAVISGHVTLAGTTTDSIVTAAINELDSEPRRWPVSSPFGDGHAADRIIAALAGGES